MIFLKRNCNINNRNTASYYFIVLLFYYFIILLYKETLHSFFFDKNKKRCWFGYSLNKLNYNKPAPLHIFSSVLLKKELDFVFLIYCFIFNLLYYCFIVLLFYSFCFSQKSPSPKKRNSKKEILKKTLVKEFSSSQKKQALRVKELKGTLKHREF